MKARMPRVVWITGASTGLGKALVEQFALKGDKVYATARSRDRLAALKRKMKKGVTITTMVCDVRRVRQVRKTAQKILDETGGVDILINNAGVTYFKTFAATTTNEFTKVIDTNLFGLFVATQALLASMTRRRRGLVINVLSYAAKKIYTSSAAYSASKAGAEALMNVLRAETRHTGIKVMNVFSGAILTTMWNAGDRRQFKNQMMSPEEIASLIHHVSTQGNNVMIEELIVRPQIGDLEV